MIYASTFLLYDHETVEDLFLAQWIAQELGKRGVITWNNPWEKETEDDTIDIAENSFPKETVFTILISKRGLESENFVNILSTLYSRKKKEVLFRQYRYIPIFLEELLQLSDLIELTDSLKLIEWLKRSSFRVISNTESNNVKRAKTIAEKIAKYIFNRLKTKEQEEIALYIDQRGKNIRNGEPANLPANLQNAEIPMLVFRPNLNIPRSEGETLYGNDWEDFRDAISWSLSQVLEDVPKGTHKKIHLLGYSQLGIPFLIGKILNRTMRIPLQCYQPPKNDIFDNKDLISSKIIDIENANPECIVGTHSDITPIPLDAEYISLLLVYNESKISEIKSYLKKHTCDENPAMDWLKYDVHFNNNNDAMQYLRNVIARMRQLKELHKKCKTFYIFTTLPFSVIALFASILQNDINNVVFLEYRKDLDDTSPNPEHLYAPLRMSKEAGIVYESELIKDFSNYHFNIFHPSTKILFLSANPQYTSKLNLEKEMKRIESGLLIGKEKANLVFKYRKAVTLEIMIQALMEENPDIVHFSGHGGQFGIMLLDEKRQVKIISAETLKCLFDEFKNKIKCVILNSCYSDIQAKVIRSFIPYVTGVNYSLKDRIAIAFSTGFYSALGAGKNIPSSFQIGLIKMKGEDINSSKKVFLF